MSNKQTTIRSIRRRHILRDLRGAESEQRNAVIEKKDRARTNGKTNERSNARATARTNGRSNERPNAPTVNQMNGRTKGRRFHARRLKSTQTNQ